MQTQFFARLDPAQKLKNAVFPKCPGKRKAFSVDAGFVKVDAEAAKFLRTIHEDGESSARGGKGPKAFHVVTQDEAKDIASTEQKMAVLQNAGRGLIHAELEAMAAKAVKDEMAKSKRGQVADDVSASADSDAPEETTASETAASADATTRPRRAGRKPQSK